ncbi:MAG TPA: hypothetical protein VFC41_09475 [Anaerovoracaceae bacterium]|nr:hypothetical protein [Anaerovoracaceae bacterium]
MIDSYRIINGTFRLGPGGQAGDKLGTSWGHASEHACLLKNKKRQMFGYKKV